jgi:transcription elongation factor GreA
MLSRSRERLEKELQALEHEYRHDLPKEIQRAKALGDLRENAEYQAALERQHYVQARMGQVQAQLRTLSMVRLDVLPRDRAALGSTVTVFEASADKEFVYELVIPEESDLSRGLISVSSPIGRALMGRQGGEEVTVQIPAGLRVLAIRKVVTIHEKEEQD